MQKQAHLDNILRPLTLSQLYDFWRARSKTSNCFLSLVLLGKDEGHRTWAYAYFLYKYNGTNVRFCRWYLGFSQKGGNVLALVSFVQSNEYHQNIRAFCLGECSSVCSLLTTNSYVYETIWCAHLYMPILKFTSSRFIVSVVHCFKPYCNTMNRFVFAARSWWIRQLKINIFSIAELICLVKRLL